MTQRLNYAHHAKDLYKKLFELSNAVKQASSLEETWLHLVDLRASQLNGCAFCVDMHVKQAKLAGERELRIYHIPVWRESTLFTDQERAVLEWTEAVTKLGEHGVSDDIFNRVREQLSEQQLAELTFAIATINAWNRLGVPFRSVPGSADAAFGLDKAGLN
jgi:AhpD family alkylhydroperoxidase